MTFAQRIVLVAMTLAATMWLGCSSDEAAPQPVPVDAAKEATADGAPKTDAAPPDQASSDGGAGDSEAGGG